MPELPEVQTMVNGLNNAVSERKILRVWVGWAKSIKYPKSARGFAKEIEGAKILRVKRLGKYIKFELDEERIILTHPKMTGHFLLGTWKMVAGKPITESIGVLKEKVNSHIRFIFYLDQGKELAFCDARKFGTMRAGKGSVIMNLPEIKNLGPDVIAQDFTAEKFAEILGMHKGKIKQVLMDQSVVSGIGNIYSDEVLWMAKIHPLRKANSLSKAEAKNLYASIREILEKSLKLRGTSSSDFRDTDGEEGEYWDHRLVYQRKGEPCQRCGTVIERIVIGARSAHYCPKCQRAEVRSRTSEVG